jgi:hypothetical protein
MAMAAYIIGMQKIASLASQKKELLSRDFLSSSRMTGKPELSVRRISIDKRLYVNGMECFRDGRLLIVFPQRDTYGCVRKG